MHKPKLTVPISDIPAFRELKLKVLNWVRPFNTFCFLDNHAYHIAPHTQECLLGVGAKRAIHAADMAGLRQMDQALQEPCWWMGHLAYDLAAGQLPFSGSHESSPISFPNLYFFEPELLIRLTEKELHIEGGNPQQVYQDILNTPIVDDNNTEPVQIRSAMTRTEYLDTIARLKAHIARGDCYEINFCQEFYAEAVKIDPVNVYRRLSALSPNPFSALYRQGDNWLICASPERFLCRQGSRIISQPMKGTASRFPGDEDRDAVLRQALQTSTKDRAENVMVVDLVRNDLARICQEGSVKVDELYGIYSFPQVHQMISTISGELSPQVTFSAIMEAMFPMGSMTGAPKKRVMELIAQYEKSRRGLFSGAVGYIDPSMNFDFNVVIRSILYNEASGYLSLPAGSGITFYSDPEKEWEECEWKIKAMKQVLESR